MEKFLVVVLQGGAITYINKDQIQMIRNIHDNYYLTMVDGSEYPNVIFGEDLLQQLNAS
jgi:hypothetical protein